MAQNLILEGYGIQLVRLAKDKIEMVRCWRNDSKISQYMFYREYITPQMQNEWFEKINNEKNYYFVIRFDNKDIGLVNLKNIESGSAEFGYFVYDDNYRGTTDKVALKSAILCLKYGFEILELESIIIPVIEDNIRSIKFAEKLGFEFYTKKENCYLCRIVNDRFKECIIDLAF